MTETGDKIPYHIAVILDGNRRWAKAKGLPTLMGHKKGAEQVRAVLAHAQERGVKVMTVYAFSTENWNRAQEEVGYLMDLLINFIDTYLNEMTEKGVRFVHLGSKEKLSSKVAEKIQQAEEQTAQNDKMIFCMAINYGGRDEITRAVKKIVEADIPADKITPEMIGENLDTAGIPDLDLIIRTSGEQRLSGFLPWQGTYSELYFTDVFWPDFDEAELDKAIAEFNRRKRRFGK